jgi:nucleoid-associated protein YgaU
VNEALRQLESLLQNATAGTKPFPPNSRYNGVPLLTHALADGRSLPYLARRFIPPAGRFASMSTHRVVEGDRLDNLAARYLGDPEQYWRLCDANGALRPDELVEAIGRSLRIALPEGIGT